LSREGRREKVIIELGKQQERGLHWKREKKNFKVPIFGMSRGASINRKQEKGKGKCAHITPELSPIGKSLRSQDSTYTRNFKKGKKHGVQKKGKKGQGEREKGKRGDELKDMHWPKRGFELHRHSSERRKTQAHC